MASTFLERIRSIFRGLGSSLLALLGLNDTTRRADDRLEVLVPAYFYPAGDDLAYWNLMEAVGTRVPLTVIANPGSGPGVGLDTNYEAAINRLGAAGVRVVGYIASGYADPTRPSYQTVESATAQVSRWHELYKVDGIFIDEMDIKPELVDSYYKPLYDAIKARFPEDLVIGNPGTIPPESYLKAADTLITYENNDVAYSYANAPVPTYIANHPARRFGAIIYNVSSASKMTEYLTLARSRNIGWILVSDEPVNNYSRLPTYWEAEINAIEAGPRPSNSGLVVGSAVVGDEVRKAAPRDTPRGS